MFDSILLLALDTGYLPASLATLAVICELVGHAAECARSCAGA
jgi:hypothetical protein